MGLTGLLFLSGSTGSTPLSVRCGDAYVCGWVLWRRCACAGGWPWRPPPLPWALRSPRFQGDWYCNPAVPRAPKDAWRTCRCQQTPSARRQRISLGRRRSPQLLSHRSRFSSWCSAGAFQSCVLRQVVNVHGPQGPLQAPARCLFSTPTSQSRHRQTCSLSVGSSAMSSRRFAV